MGRINDLALIARKPVLFRNKRNLFVALTVQLFAVLILSFEEPRTAFELVFINATERLILVIANNNINFKTLQKDYHELVHCQVFFMHDETLVPTFQMCGPDAYDPKNMILAILKLLPRIPQEQMPQVENVSKLNFKMYITVVVEYNNNSL